MKIVIAGSGDGEPSGEDAERQRHDITIIDSDQTAFRRGESGRRLPSRGFDDFRRAPQGFGAQVRPFIAVNHEENDNVVAAMLAKKLGARKSIARIDNNEYLEPNNKEMFIDMGIDYLFYPEKVAAREVNLLGHTSTTEYVDFSSGKLAAVFRLEPASLVDGDRGFDDDETPLSYRTVAITGQADDHPRQGEIFHRGRRDLRHRASGRREAGCMEFSGQSNIEIKNMISAVRASASASPPNCRRGEHQAGRLQRREGLPAGGAARQDADNQRGWSQHRGHDGGGFPIWTPSWP